MRNIIQGIAKPDIPTCARRGVIKRILGDIYGEVRCVLRHILANVIQDSVTYTENARRKTVAALDVVLH
jgi:histone H4